MRGIASVAASVARPLRLRTGLRRQEPTSVGEGRSASAHRCVGHCEKSETGGRRERRDLDLVFCVEGTQLLGLSCKEEPFVSYDKGDLLAETGLEAEG